MSNLTFYASETELLKGLHAGDRRAFEQVISLHSKKLIRSAYNRLYDLAEAEDLVQDLMVELWEKREALHINGSLAAYLQVALRNRVFTSFRRAALHQRAAQHMVEKMETIQAAVSDMLVQHDLDTMLSEALAGLPDTMQKIFVLRGEDYSLKEIASILGLAEQTVKGYSAEMIRRLRKTMIANNPDMDRSIFIFLAYFLM